MVKVIKKFNICVIVDTYTNKQGEEKNVWKTIGEIVDFDNGGKLLKLYATPNTRYSVFEQKPREAKGQEQVVDADTGQDNSENIDVNKIKF